MSLLQGSQLDGPRVDQVARVGRVAVVRSAHRCPEGAHTAPTAQSAASTATAAAATTTAPPKAGSAAGAKVCREHIFDQDGI